ncbi:hypothetical protein PNH38_01565 [Anoxybacillus rupiensis]|uniref:Uncharacterized protein n=1 Tax=Anoxybacteroides rupiense TaxID=311460 RepID=A0ABT5VZQ5_9BACL|nr:hypothetical protein [Anoxybacillus rupiensis]
MNQIRFRSSLSSPLITNIFIYETLNMRLIVNYLLGYEIKSSVIFLVFQRIFIALMRMLMVV